MPDKRPKGGSARSGISRQNASTKSTADTRDRAIPWRAVRNEERGAMRDERLEISDSVFN